MMIEGRHYIGLIRLGVYDSECTFVLRSECRLFSGEAIDSRGSMNNNQPTEITILLLGWWLCAVLYAVCGMRYARLVLLRNCSLASMLVFNGSRPDRPWVPNYEILLLQDAQ